MSLDSQSPAASCKSSFLATVRDDELGLVLLSAGKPLECISKAALPHLCAATTAAGAADGFCRNRRRLSSFPNC